MPPLRARASSTTRQLPATRTTSANHILLACTYFRVRFQANDDAVAFRELGVGDFGGRTGGRGWEMQLLEIAVAVAEQV